MSESIRLIQQHVSQHLEDGGTIDVYLLAERLQEHCPDLKLEAIAKAIGEAVVLRGGSALWDKSRLASKNQGSAEQSGTDPIDSSPIK